MKIKIRKNKIKIIENLDLSEAATAAAESTCSLKAASAFFLLASNFSSLLE